MAGTPETWEGTADEEFVLTAEVFQDGVETVSVYFNFNEEEIYV